MLELPAGVAGEGEREEGRQRNQGGEERRGKGKVHLTAALATGKKETPARESQGWGRRSVRGRKPENEMSSGGYTWASSAKGKRPGKGEAK